MVYVNIIWLEKVATRNMNKKLLEIYCCHFTVLLAKILVSLNFQRNSLPTEFLKSPVV